MGLSQADNLIAAADTIAAPALSELELLAIVDDLHQAEVRLTPGAGGAAAIPRAGSVLWACQERAACSLSWAWCEIEPGVFAVEDPMAIEGAFALIDPSGVQVSASVRMLLLNQVVRRLPWQARLAAHLAAT